jgi:RNA polymerase sigma factor (sigma-70 family)
MRDLSDKKLICNVRYRNCSQSFTEICRRYENAFYKICQKYTHALINAGICPDDIYNEKNVIILHCIKTYKASKGSKLSTWICNYARYLCLNAINSRKSLISVDSDAMRDLIDGSAGSLPHENAISTTEDFDYLSNILSQIKDKRIHQIMTMRHLSDKKQEWKQIAKKLNISSQTVINLHARGIKMLKKKYLSKTVSDVI